jgi:hypothetical protein
MSRSFALRAQDFACGAQFLAYPEVSAEGPATRLKFNSPSRHHREFMPTVGRNPYSLPRTYRLLWFSFASSQDAMHNS